MKAQIKKMDKNIKDVVHKIEEKFKGINVIVYYLSINNMYYIVIPENYFNDLEFLKFDGEIDDECFLKNVTNYCITDKIFDKRIEKVYDSFPQLVEA